MSRFPRRAYCFYLRYVGTPGCTTQACGVRDHLPDYDTGVWAEKSMYGRTDWGVLRATFVIDPDGTVVHVIPKVSPKTHDEQILASLAGMWLETRRL